MPKVTKQRNRIPLSCNNCRKKKIKCDRSRPICTICIAHGTSSTCSYYAKPDDVHNNNINNLSDHDPEFKLKESLPQPHQDQKISPETPLASSISPPISTKDIQITHLQAQIKTLQEKLQQFTKTQKNTHLVMSNANSVISTPSTPATPQLKITRNFGTPINNKLANYICEHLSLLNVDINDKFDIYKPIKNQFNLPKPSLNEYRNALFNSGPFSWLSIMSRDPLAAPVTDAVLLAKKDILTKFQKSALQKSFFDINRVDINNDNVPPNSNVNKLSNSLNQHETLQICKNIINVLPNKRVIWLFIDRFFKYLYPFMPYLDQDLFTADIERILNTSRTNDLKSNFEIKVTSFSLTEYPDLSIIGSLLIVLKFSYESLFATDGSFVENKPHKDLEDYLVKFNQHDILIKYANQCLNQYLLLLKRSPLPILQCALLFREYQKVNGCDVFVDGDSYIYTGLLIQIATTLGLNKEPPSPVAGDTHTLKLNQLKRKIWFSLVSADINQYTQMGIPPVVDDKFYNTNLPEFDPNASNVSDLSLEETTCKMLNLRYQVEKLMKVLTDRIINMKETPTVGEVVYYVIALENELKTKFDTLNELLRSDHQNNHYKKVEKVFKFSQLIYALTFLLPVYMCCFYQYSEKRNFTACFFLFNKSMSFWMFILGNMQDLVESPQLFFDYGFEIVLAPVIEIIISKTCSLPTTTIIRFHKAAINVQEKNPQLANLLKTFIDSRLIFFDSSVFANVLQLLSKRYFYAWRIYKIHLFLIDKLHKGMLNVKTENEESIFNFIEYLTIENINQLSNIMNHRYFSARIKQPAWLLEWVKQVNEFVYDPYQHIDFNNDTNSEIYDNVSNLADTHSSFSLDTHDEKWFSKIYNKIIVSNAELPPPVNNRISTAVQIPVSNSQHVSTVLNPPVDYNSQFQTHHQAFFIPQPTVFPTSHPSVNINNSNMGYSYIYQANQMNQLLNMNNVNDLLNYYEPSEWSSNPTLANDLNIPPANIDSTPR